MYPSILNIKAFHLVISQHDMYIFAEYTGQEGSYHGYSTSNLLLVSPEFHKVNYYDNYCFLADGLLPSSVPSASVSYVAQSGYGEKSVSAKGSLTGSLISQMGGSSALLARTFYYDARGRMIQSHASNHLYGIESEYFSYDFHGRELSRKHLYSVPGKAPISEVYTYTYDSDTGLRLSTRHRLGSGSDVLLSEQVYDCLGRLLQTKRNNKPALQSNNSYNVRSWLTGISGELFTQQLYYNADGGNTTHCYNGNISSMTWQCDDGILHGYKYTYDRLNRLLHATYGQGSSINAFPDRFTEQVTSYDGKRAVSTQYALLFEAALGIDADIWIRQQARYDMQMAKSDKSFLERLANIRKVAAVL